MPSKLAHMAWIDEAGDRPVVLRPGFSCKKRLLTIFFIYTGPLVVDILPEKTTMTSHHYTETVLPKVVAAVQDQRPNVGTSRSMLLHDNAAPHKARATTQYLEAVQLHQLPHPAYSPDLAPCDFWLFPTLKAALAEKKFLRIQDLARAVNSQLHGIPSLEYHNAFQKWLRRLQHYVDSRGEYFKNS
jgi:histone-lysine N-methyltransferase SETMAR